MKPTANSFEREAVESCLKQGIKALQRALNDAPAFDQAVVDTRSIERELQYALDMIRGVCMECHRKNGETYHLPLPILHPSRN